MTVSIEVKTYSPDEVNQTWDYCFLLIKEENEYVAAGNGKTLEEARQSALKELKEVWQAITKKLTEEGVFRVNRVEALTQFGTSPPTSGEPTKPA